MTVCRQGIVVVVILLLVWLSVNMALLDWPAWARHTTFIKGDIFVAVGNGKVQWRHADGSLNKILDTGTRSKATTGMALDAIGNLYVTNFHASSVSKFDQRGNLLGTFGSRYDRAPESIVFDRTGNIYRTGGRNQKHPEV